EGDRADFVPVGGEVEFGAADVAFLQFGGNAGESEAGLDLRLLDLTVRAEKLPALGPVAADQGTAPDISGRRSRVPMALAVGLGVTLVIAVGVWLVLRQRSAARAGAGANSTDRQATHEPAPWS